MNNLPSNNEIKAFFSHVKFAIGNEVMRESWRSGVYTKHGVKYPNLPNRSSAPYEQFARQSGKLNDSIDVKIIEDIIMIGSDVPYLKYLELGTSKMKPRPTLKLSYEATDIKSIIDDKVKRFFR